MKYVLLFHLDENRWSELSPAERTEIVNLCGCYVHRLKTCGHSARSVTLHPSFTATTLRLQAGHRVLKDGPATKSMEVLAAYQIVECRDLDEAIDLAAQFPPLRSGASVEVRPIRTDDGLLLQL